MVHKIFVTDFKISRFFPKPKLNLKRILEAIVLSACYLTLFYNLQQLTQMYLLGSNFVDFRMALVFSVLAIMRSIFRESIVAPIAGLTSVGLMFNFFYSSGSLRQFGVLQLQTGLMTVKIKFVTLLIIILTILALKTSQYIYEIIKNLKVKEPESLEA